MYSFLLDLHILIPSKPDIYTIQQLFEHFIPAVRRPSYIVLYRAKVFERILLRRNIIITSLTGWDNPCCNVCREKLDCWLSLTRIDLKPFKCAVWSWMTERAHLNNPKREKNSLWRHFNLTGWHRRHNRLKKKQYVYDSLIHVHTDDRIIISRLLFHKTIVRWFPPKNFIYFFFLEKINKSERRVLLAIDIGQWFRRLVARLPLVNNIFFLGLFQHLDGQKNRYKPTVKG